MLGIDWESESDCKKPRIRGNELLTHVWIILCYYIAHFTSHKRKFFFCRLHFARLDFYCVISGWSATKIRLYLMELDELDWKIFCLDSSKNWLFFDDGTVWLSLFLSLSSFLPGTNNILFKCWTWTFVHFFTIPKPIKVSAAKLLHSLCYSKGIVDVNPSIHVSLSLRSAGRSQLIKTLSSTAPTTVLALLLSV